MYCQTYYSIWESNEMSCPWFLGSCTQFIIILLLINGFFKWSFSVLYLYLLSKWIIYAKVFSICYCCHWLTIHNDRWRKREASATFGGWPRRSPDVFCMHSTKPNVLSSKNRGHEIGKVSQQQETQNSFQHHFVMISIN